jgi:hypothetical protein
LLYQHTHQPTSHTSRYQPMQPYESGVHRKMLASTMQISNNNPTNPHHHRPQPTGHTDDSRQREDQKPQPERLILQDPTVCLTPPPPT